MFKNCNVRTKIRGGVGVYEGIVEGIVNRLSVINYLHHIVFQCAAEYKIGVLAKRGVEHAMKQWGPTANI